MVKRSEMTQEQKQAQNKYNAKYVARYNANSYDKLTIRIRKDGADGVTVEDIKAAAGNSVNKFILAAIREKMEREEKALSELMQALAAHEGQRAIEENERLKADPAAEVPQELHDKVVKLLNEM